MKLHSDLFKKGDFWVTFGVEASTIKKLSMMKPDIIQSHAELVVTPT